MTEVSLYVAVITAGAGILGGAVPQGAILARDARQAARERRERRERGLRKSSLRILGAAGQLRAQVGNAVLYRGTEIATRLAEIRSTAAFVQQHADEVSFLTPDSLSAPAQELAGAAARLADAAVASTDLGAGQLRSAPDLAGLDRSTSAFRLAALTIARGQRPRADPPDPGPPV